MMKWWGWGGANISFPMEDKPNLWPWIQSTVGLPDNADFRPIKRESIQLDPPKIHVGFISAVKNIVAESQVHIDEEERLLHSYGKSFPDLYRVRRGIIKQAPDAIITPRTHEEVEKIVNLAVEYDICLIPFGGGTNIVGGIDPLEKKGRMVISLDMREMCNLISIDKYSNTATIQAGALGPKLEMDLEKEGFSLGHYPDSFEYSTLGGWLATRSAGMQSDAYGKIEDMVVALKLVTASGTIVTKPVPKASAGPDLNQLVVGSEGVLGVITEATMRVHPIPKIKKYSGYLFKSFQDGVNAIHECIKNDISPSLIRLQDSGETELAFNMKAPPKGAMAPVQKSVKAYLKSKGYTSPCIMVIGFEGSAKNVSYTNKQAIAILKKHKGFPLGDSVGKTWSKDKYNVPYLRDFVMDYGCVVDVSETSATWSNIISLHANVTKVIKEKFSSEYGKGYVGCHISHTYKTGACLYFTYAAREKDSDGLKQYYEYKKLVTDAIVKNGGTLSHHHAVGYEHLPWMKEEVSETGIKALLALKNALDPKEIFNPGKLIPRD